MALCFRSLKATLVAAASTSALFAAANWDLAIFIQKDFEDRPIIRVVAYTLFGFSTPLVPLMYSMLNAIKVWAVERSVQICNNSLEYIDHGSIAIITICPTFIIFPAAVMSGDELGERFRSYQCIKDFQKLVKDVCPLELRGASGSPQCTRKTINSTDAAHNVNDDDIDALQGSSTQFICLQLPNTFNNLRPEEELQERAALLHLRLAPSYKELRFLRSRNKFQTVVTALQASGYLITLVQRLLQHLSVSPIEAITAFFCIIIGLQLLTELYACSHCQRPLLIRLSTHQFRCFRDVPRDKRIILPQSYFLILLFTVCLVMLSLAMFYFVHYVRHACLICSLPALLFFIAQAVFVMGLVVALIGPTWCAGLSKLGLLFLFFSATLHVCSIILAVISTTIKWKAFHETSHRNWFAWLFPHLQSG